MIRINLITVKRRKPIQIPFAAIFLVAGLVVILAGFMFMVSQSESWNDDVKKKQEDLKKQVASKNDKFNQRDMLRSQLNQLNTQVEQLKQLSGVDLVQWSMVFSKMTDVVPPKTVWITNMTIDSDRRVQMTGFSTAAEEDKARENLTRGIQDFIKSLQKSDGFFQEIFLLSANKTSHVEQTVMRFDITARLKRSLKGN